MSGIYSIPWEQPFLQTLAAGLLARCREDPLALSNYTVLLPTRRAIRALQDAFLTVSANQALLLPTLSPLGDIDDESFLFEEAGDALDDLSIPPAMLPGRRMLLLATLIARREEMAFSQALRLAEALGALLDSLQIEAIPLEALDDLVPEELALHWQQTLTFLQLLRGPWQAILAEEGVIDAAARRNRVLARRAELWKQNAPEGPIIIAGSTGTMPATAALMKVVAGLPQGEVILPGLDPLLAPSAWPLLAASHPQYALRQILARLDRQPDDVDTWPDAFRMSPASSAQMHRRAALISQAMHPAPLTAEWHATAPGDTGPFVDVAYVSCRDNREEAAFIAACLRRFLALSQVTLPGSMPETAVLVTPDRSLAKRVRAELRRWQIDIDDSAGEPLAETAAGAYVRLTARLIDPHLSPVDLLAALKHPFARLGLPVDAYQRAVRQLDKALRGPRPAAGFSGLRQHITVFVTQSAREAGLDRFLDQLEATLKSFQRLHATPHAIADFLTEHISIAEQLAQDADGDNPLWQGESGALLAETLTNLRDAAVGLPAVTAADYQALVDRTLQQQVLRSRYRRHPRLAILGPLEARLQSADFTILAGLNEATWPMLPDPGPWLSRPMRLALGLPDPERRIGLSAHDFCQALAAPRVLLTRAEKVDGTPTVASRWLLRLQTILALKNLHFDNQDMEPVLHWVRQLDRPAQVRPVSRPAPKPPLAARPRQLSTTQIEVWMRDAYALYARHILKLLPLQPLDAPFGPADRGMAIHDALDRFIRAVPGQLPDDAADLLRQAGEKSFAHLMGHPEVVHFWWPRFCRIVEWVIAHEQLRRPMLTPLASEVSGAIDLAAPAGPFRLTAKADRIDGSPDSELVIVDYKTGAVPTRREMDLGLSPQLPLEAAIATAGGFSGIPAGAVIGAEYWRLVGNETAGELYSFTQDTGLDPDAALAGLGRLIAAFDDETTGYVAQNAGALRFNDYAHLARTREWSAGGVEE